jgi:hypothetical protein
MDSTAPGTPRFESCPGGACSLRAQSCTSTAGGLLATYTKHTFPRITLLAIYQQNQPCVGFVKFIQSPRHFPNRQACATGLQLSYHTVPDTALPRCDKEACKLPAPGQPHHQQEHFSCALTAWRTTDIPPLRSRHPLRTSLPQSCLL